MTRIPDVDILRKILSVAGDRIERAVMQLAGEVKSFLSTSERLLACIAVNRQLSEDEARLIEYYCKELLAKIAPRLTNP